MSDLLQTIAEIAAAFAGFASVVVIFRRRGNVHTDEATRVTFQSMLLGSLFVVFFSLLPLILDQLLVGPELAYFYAAALLFGYIAISFIWGMIQGTNANSSAIPYFVAAFIIATTQLAGLLGVGCRVLDVGVGTV